MNYVLTLLVLTLAMSCATSESTDKKTPEQKRAEIYYNYGTQMLVSQKYTDALKNLLEAYKLAPEESRISNNLGMAYYFKGQVATAISFVNKAIQLDNTNSDARNNLASIYFDQKKYDQALALYQEVSKDLVYSHQYRIYGNMGLIYRAKGMNQAAIEHFKLSIKENVEYCPSYYNLGTLSMERFDYQSAIESFRDGTKGTCFNQPAMHYALGEAYIKTHDYLKAEEKFIDITKRFANTTWASKAQSALARVKPYVDKKNKASASDIAQAVQLYEQIKSESTTTTTKSPSF